MAKRKGYKLFLHGKDLRKTENMCAKFTWEDKVTRTVPCIFKNATMLAVTAPDMGEEVPWEDTAEAKEHLVTVEVSLDGQQYSQGGLQFLYKSVDPSLTEEALKAMDAEDAKGKKPGGKKK